MTDTATRPSITPAVDETIVANRMFAAAFECAIYDRLAPFQRRALEAAMNANDDGAAHPLAEIVHKHRSNAWLAMDGAFKVDADRSFNDFAQAAALEIKAAIGIAKATLCRSVRQKRIDHPKAACPLSWGKNG